jgi:hypothetical protein
MRRAWVFDGAIDVNTNFIRSVHKFKIETFQKFFFG